MARLRLPLDVFAKHVNRDSQSGLCCPLADESDHQARREKLAYLCADLSRAASRPETFLEESNELLSTLLPSATTRILRDADESVTKRASHLLERLPRTPVRAFALSLDSRNPEAQNDSLWDRMNRIPQCSPHWLIDEAKHRAVPQGQVYSTKAAMDMLAYMSHDVWDDLVVTNYVDDNTLAILVMLASRAAKVGSDFAHAVYRYLDVLAHLLDLFDDLSAGVRMKSEDYIASFFREDDIPHLTDQEMSIAKAFLWSAWQRSMMLHLYTVVGIQLYQGSTAAWNDVVAVRGVRRLVDIGDTRMGDYRGENTSEYLCNWAFEMLRRSRTAVGLDFRCLLERFTSQFDEMPGRCIESSSEPCQGNDPASCERFTGATTLAQSAHSLACAGGCIKIYWKEASYRQTASPRAVDICNSSTSLHYTVASQHTLAISHVWAHGQGGRPEDGINSCLHERYCKLATRHRCDSYWIDSACIPDDDALRKEAISKINTIFATSKAVLISDKDVQSVELADQHINRLETALSVLLLCDWNVRAWTMLEATRGNRALHLLCKGDETISLTDLMRRVWEDGSISLAILIGSGQHLMPTEDRTQCKPVEEAGHILSQRHASRSGDDVVIWGLLAGSQHLNDAAKFWRSQIILKTAFIMSSTPRLQGALGLGWAPATPTNIPQKRSVKCGQVDQSFMAQYHSYDGYGSYHGQITTTGLKSRWLYMEMDSDFPSVYRERFYDDRVILVPGSPREPTLYMGPSTTDELDLWAQPDAALAYQTICQLLQQWRVRVVRPLAADGQSPYTGADNRGDFTGLTAAIVFSKDHGVSWEWAGVHQWWDDYLPSWERDEMLLV